MFVLILVPRLFFIMHSLSVLFAILELYNFSSALNAL